MITRFQLHAVSSMRVSNVSPEGASDNWVTIDFYAAGRTVPDSSLLLSSLQADIRQRLIDAFGPPADSLISGRDDGPVLSDDAYRNLRVRT